MEEVISSVNRLASETNEAGRKKLIDGLRDIANSLETPDDTLQRLMYMHLQIASVRIGIDLKLFDLLSASTEPLTVEQLRQKTGAAPVFLGLSKTRLERHFSILIGITGRMLRYLASIGMIKEVETDKFTSTNITDALAIPGNQAGVHHM